MEISSETPAKRSKRLTSVVWNHFERVRKGEICYAVCVHCKKKLSGSSNSGTTHLRNHLLRCLKRSDVDVSQIIAAKRKRKDSTLCVTNVAYEEGQRKEEIVRPLNFKFDHDPKKEESSLPVPVNIGCVKFEQERSRLDLARMIMLHGYPMAMVDHVGFKIFVKNLQPFFEFVTNSAIELDCMTIYAKEKQKIYETIHNLHGRISLAAEIWASTDNTRYLCLTAHYIDEDWKLQKKILNFITLDVVNADDLLSEVVIKCLTDWAIDRKLFSMTFDDFSGYDDMIFRIKDWLSQNKPLLKNGELFDVRCASNVLKSIVLDVMEALRGVTLKIRESIRHVKSSQETLGKFNEIAQEVGINSERHLVLDCPMQWHSTYMMLEAALEYRGAFSLLQENDSDYKISLSEKEWEWASSVTGYVKLFVEVTNVFAGNKYLTPNIYFPEICDIHIQLTEWCRSTDDFLGDIARKMKAKFDLYWNSTSLDQEPLGQGNSPSTCTGTRDRLRGFDKFLNETSQTQSVASDLVKYLEEPVFPRNYDFNILNWWKVHTPRYPILSLMARDILGIPASTIGPELAFSNQVRVLDQSKSSLHPNTREALICGQDWLRLESEESSSSLNHAIPLMIEPN
ncbi:zinc finger BED domain-containing protein RICESLEEPER 2-like isoform X2 [Ipomoea triloba]|uniref:zinc finger BED domain-containing protein RICESLEEPER 2-like isoform X2 n=1 Tax=Ipomoea triloba TaxID=35885 RepID=UPI00125D75D8|nr:zinc finger BED domain-containing protein RICESLEEPER 2-like isoform X2 [Ipomoea triloba]